MSALHPSDEPRPLEISIPVAPGVDLKIADRLEHLDGYATSILPKGLLLFLDGRNLAEEAVGFGFPVAKRGLTALFPGRIELLVKQHGPTWSVEAVFTLNLEERISRSGNGSVRNRAVYAIKDLLAALIRRFPPLRGILTAVSSRMRAVLGWNTIYEGSGIQATIKTIHTIDENSGKIKVEIDLAELPSSITEVVVMNEQGAHYFDQYMDSMGVLLQKEEIGCWDEVTAEKAGFISSSAKVAFRLSQGKGARLFRGRELVGSRLAWAGFGYSLPPSTTSFIYELEIERLT
jgi:hypothetical protein